MRKSSCFLETSAVLLSKFVQKAHFRGAGEYAKTLDGGIDEEDKAKADLSEDEIDFQTELYSATVVYTMCKFCPDAKITRQGLPLRHYKALRYLSNMMTPCGSFVSLCRYFWLQRRNNSQKKE